MDTRTGEIFREDDVARLQRRRTELAADELALLAAIALALPFEPTGEPILDRDVLVALRTLARLGDGRGAVS